jgi:hypothetical protein
MQHLRVHVERRHRELFRIVVIDLDGDRPHVVPCLADVKTAKTYAALFSPGPDQVLRLRARMRSNRQGSEFRHTTILAVADGSSSVGPIFMIWWPR